MLLFGFIDNLDVGIPTHSRISRRRDRIQMNKINTTTELLSSSSTVYPKIINHVTVSNLII